MKALRYRMRTLLIVVAVLAPLFGWLGYTLQQAREQHRAATAILKIGGSVHYDFQYQKSGAHGSGIDKQATSDVPQFIRSLFGDTMFSKVTYVSLTGDSVTSEHLRHLRALPHLKTLFLAGDNISADGLSNLRNALELEDLSLGIQLTNADLDQLAHLKSLKELYLMGPSNNGFVLRLHSRSRRIFDASDYESEVTLEGVERLAAKLPSCRITF